MTSIAWIGLGNMGSRMSAHLVSAGHDVRGFDVVEALRARAAEHGITPTASIAEAVEGAEVVILSLPKGDHVREVLAGAEGVFAHAAAGTLVLDTSTVDVETSAWCHDEAGSRGLRFVDAPVSGGIQGAAAATLTFMLGGDAADVEDARAVVTPMAGNVFAVGEATHGIAAKLVNNMMLGISILAMSEGSQLAKQLGLDPKAFFDVARVSSGDSWAVRTWYPVPGVVAGSAADDNFDASFSAMLAHKDVALAVAGAEATGVAVPAATLIRDQLQRLLDDGLGGKDCTLVVREASPDGAVEGWDGR
ncbi:NAD(P)-binding domain-containing protein [Agrococcus sp. SL85]|uniref:NAD(P)-dependent oxidoreductase n=1 Tax=Agrococcus sp. SL85 TaxID=2995141 RepID=UPI00226CA2BB|nr:NAD(P)-binding domain-containing protein [Agrococcus sp. SL85]WAC65788.1 NAD(P)-binding domain-containing protein [Agrococcus sp. SL85]